MSLFSYSILYLGPVFFEVIYANSQPRQGWENPVYQFVKQLEDVSNRCSVPFRMLSNQAKMANSIRDLDREVKSIYRRREAHFSLVIFADDTWYAQVKYAADKRGIITQCVRLQKIDKLPGINMLTLLSNRWLVDSTRILCDLGGYTSNVVLKVNSKLGGICHTLISRGNRHVQHPFQNPVNSLGWLFDEPCMLVGIDTSHPPVGSTGSNFRSVSAIVGSLDGALSQYGCYFALEPEKSSLCTCIENGLAALLHAFEKRNKCCPKRIIIFRDGKHYCLATLSLVMAFFLTTSYFTFYFID